MGADARWPAELRRKLRVAILRAAREPLVQFFAIALVLFAANALVHGTVVRPSGRQIEISAGRVTQIAASYRLLAGRPPSRAELQTLVDDFVDEEIGYREAVALGLDADDTIVRRRMRQKLEFLAEDATADEEPSDAELTAWLASRAADYRLPPRISFRHVLANADMRGADAEADAAAFAAALRAGTDPATLGDASMLPSVLPLTTQQEAAALFGDAFAAAIFARTNEEWFGPVVSPLGAHAVSILAREAGRDPTLAEVRTQLRSDWLEARRKAMRATYLARLRQRYEVGIEWPEAYAAQPSTDVLALRDPSATVGVR